MLPYLADYLSDFVWGPFRLLKSYLVLMGGGALLGAFLCWFLLPKFWHLLPTDRGKAISQDGGKAAKGKPTGAGVIVVSITVILLLLFMPLSCRTLGVLLCLFVIMMTGFLDDAAKTPWSEGKKGVLDLIVSFAAAAFFSQGEEVRIWLPLFKGEFMMSPWLYVPIAGLLLFVCINAVNCSDGVDGLAGSLSIMTLLELGGFLYVVIGHNQLAEYLIVPHYGSGADWAVMMFISAGVFSGYLWYNANPSDVLMGDAGSRFLGLLIGIGALATGNMFTFLIVAPILMINGGSGLVKLTVLRTLKKLGFDVRQPRKLAKNPQDAQNYADEQESSRQLWIVRTLHSIRFPLHDHCKQQLKWSNPQVMVRFVLLQAFITPVLFILLIKLR